ncbi:MAG TPA: hypothetical protein PLA68_06395 [Panacibacter sp.]|nr:hypothetical protein [Panacibacter sp.]
MKKLIAIIIVSLNIFLVSCLDTEEKITIKADNTGTYQLTMDMGGMMSQLKAFKPDEAETFEQNKDTIILFKSFTDTATALSAEEKAMLEKGFMHIVMNSEKDDMSMAFEVPFKNMQQLLYLKQHMFEMISKMQPEKKLMCGEDNGDNMPNALAGKTPDPGNLLNPAQQAFSFNIDKNVISNKLTDKDAIQKSLGSDSSMQMIMQMVPFMGDFNYKTTFILPSPVKHYSGGSESKLSDDKKTITFTSSLTGLMDKPESFEYSVEY